MAHKKAFIIILLTREQWLGIVILTIIVGTTMFLLHKFQPIKEEPTIVIADSTLVAFSAYQAQQDSIRKAEWKRKYPRDTITIHLQPFDPNTADSSTLIHLGLKRWQVNNLLKYRAKGGRYRQANELKKLYGMTDSMYLVLLPYITIDTMAVDYFRDSIKVRYRDSITAIFPNANPKHVSHKRDTILNLRTADTTELQKIRGIGSYRAKQIVRYREQLGGFVAINQLKEIKALEPLFSDSLSADSLLLHFFIDSAMVEPLYVNHLRPEMLQRHPYIRFEQAKAIYELRRKKIRLDSIQQLYRLDCFKPEDLERLAPYLHFETHKITNH